MSSLQKSIQEPTTKQEREVVRILEWLSFDPSGRVACLKRSNSILRKYLCKFISIFYVDSEVLLEIVILRRFIHASLILS